MYLILVFEISYESCTTISMPTPAGTLMHVNNSYLQTCRFLQRLLKINDDVEISLHGM